MRLHFLSSRATAAMLAVALTACGGGASTAPEARVAAVHVSPDRHALVVGQTVQLQGVVKGADGGALEGRAVTWRSEQSAVATVNGQGVVSAAGIGVATVVAASGGKEGRATIVVSAAPSDAVASVTLDAAQATITTGQTRQLTATLRDAHGNALSGRVVAWSTGDAGVATVSQSGLVTAVATGQTKITASSEGKSAEVAVTVTAPSSGVVASVTIDAATLALDEGGTRQLVATARDAQGNAITGLYIGWTSSDPAVVHVGALGLATAVRTGTATITARAHGQEATAEVTVTADYGYDLLYYAYAGQSGEMKRLDITQPGAAPATLLPGESSASQPKPSPDGTKLAFVCPNQVLGDPAICVANRDGSGRHVVAFGVGESLQEPTWSPDGTKLAYVRTGNQIGTAPTVRSNIWIVNVDGTGAVNLTAGMGGNQMMPAWSPTLPDGTQRIAFAHDPNSTNGAFRIWSMRVDGGDKRQLTTAAGAIDVQPAWSPDGATIAFQRTSAGIFGDLWLVDAAGGDERALLPAPLAGWQGSPTWSPDGRLVAFASPHETYGSGSPVYQIYTVWADGSKLARRTFDAGDKGTPAWQPRP